MVSKPQTVSPGHRQHMSALLYTYNNSSTCCAIHGIKYEGESIGRCTRLALIHLYHLYIECLFCGEAAVKTHGPHSRPLTAQNSVVQTDIILNHPLTSIRLCHEEETLLGFPSHFTQFDSIFLLIQPV